MLSKSMRATSKKGCRRRLQPFSPFRRLSWPVRRPVAVGSRTSVRNDDKNRPVPIIGVCSRLHHGILKKWLFAPAAATQRRFCLVNGGPVAEHRMGISGWAGQRDVCGRVDGCDRRMSCQEIGAGYKSTHVKASHKVLGDSVDMQSLYWLSCRKVVRVPARGHTAVRSKVHRYDAALPSLGRRTCWERRKTMYRKFIL